MKKYQIRKSVVAIVLLIMVTAFMLVGCTGSSAGPDDSWDKVKEKGEFVLGLDASFPPMGFTDENGEIVGFDIDVANEVFSRMGVTLKLQPIIWDANIQELNSGNIDCIWNGFTINAERKEKVLFTKPYMRNRQVLLVTGDSDYSKLSDFEGKKLGLQAGSSAIIALDSSKDFKSKLNEVVFYDDNMAALLDLEKGGIDVVLLDEIVARYYMQMKDKGFRLLDEALAEEEFGIGFRKGDKKLMQKVQETLNEMAEDGKLAEISTKWFDRDITTIGK